MGLFFNESDQLEFNENQIKITDQQLRINDVVLRRLAAVEKGLMELKNEK